MEQTRRRKYVFHLTNGIWNEERTISAWPIERRERALHVSVQTHEPWCSENEPIESIYQSRVPRLALNQK